MDIPEDIKEAILPDPIKILREIEKSCMPKEEKCVRTFHDYNNAVITTFKEYYDSKIPMATVDVFEVLSRVALHLFGFTTGIGSDAEVKNEA